MKQREIKFRAWFKGNRWDDDYDPQMIKDIQDLYDGSIPGPTGGHGSFGSVLKEPEHFVVMQYIDLKDSDEKQVYEGDIVEAKSWNPMRYVVEFIEGGFCLTNPKLSGSPIDINMMYSSTGCAFTVVGNIFENPELTPK